MHEHERKRALERRLREAGASRSQAMAAISRGWRFRHLEDLPPLRYMRTFYDNKFGAPIDSDHQRRPAATEQARPGGIATHGRTERAAGKKASGARIQRHRNRQRR